MSKPKIQNQLPRQEEETQGQLRVTQIGNDLGQGQIQVVHLKEMSDLMLERLMRFLQLTTSHEIYSFQSDLEELIDYNNTDALVKAYKGLTDAQKKISKNTFRYAKISSSIFNKRKKTRNFLTYKEYWNSSKLGLARYKVKIVQKESRQKKSSVFASLCFIGFLNFSSLFSQHMLNHPFTNDCTYNLQNGTQPGSCFNGFLQNGTQVKICCNPNLQSSDLGTAILNLIPFIACTIYNFYFLCVEICISCKSRKKKEQIQREHDQEDEDSLLNNDECHCD